MFKSNTVKGAFSGSIPVGANGTDPVPARGVTADRTGTHHLAQLSRPKEMPVSKTQPPMPPLVLIVDDDITTARSLEGLLRRSGLETVCAHDLSSAKALLLSHRISLILLDVYLPDGYGLDLCCEVAAQSSMATIPILFISASDDLDTKVRGFAAGGVDYITKPFAGAEVIARVRTHLRLRSAYESLAELQTERIQGLASSQQLLMPLPENFPEAGFQVCMRQALQAGGDFYDVFPSGNRVFDYVVADASGHDLGASLWTASFKALLSEYASVLHEPRDICRLINASLRRILPEGSYFTAIYARLNRASNRFNIVNAGHPSAILVTDQGRQVRLLTQEGDIIGMFPDATFGFLEVPVRPGDRLFLYSDGLVEMRGSRDEGTGYLMNVCRSVCHLPPAEAVSYIVNLLSDGHEPEDDIVLMGIDV